MRIIDRSIILSAVLTATLLSGPANLMRGTPHEIQDEGKMTSVQLGDEQTDLSNVDPSLLKIHVSLLLEQHQSDISHGLQAVVIFQNRGPATVELRSLNDSTNIEILTKDGWPVKVPRGAPESLIHTIHPPGQARSSDTVHIKPEEEYKLPIQVLRIFPVRRNSLKSETGNEALADKPANNEPIPIPAGQYKIRLRTTLIPNSEYIRGPRSVVSHFVEVTLGP